MSGFTLLIGWIWFRDVPAKKGITGALMIIVAALIASSPAAVEPRHLPTMLISLSAPNTVLPQNASDWQLIAGLALCTALLPQLLYTTFAPMIGAVRSAVAGSVELPTMFFIGWYTLGEVIGVAQWVACLLITLAILMTPARATPNLATEMVPQRKAV